MTQAAGESGAEAPEAGGEPQPTHPARELSLHLLRMLETRMEAAGLVIQAETQRIVQRLQLKVLGAAALFIALWGGIVLLAIVLPENWRVPVLAGVIVLLVALGAWALLAARREAEAQAVGTLSWFLEGIRQDLEIFSRSLQTPAAEAPRTGNAPDDRGPNDIAA
jgi:uncharacterized membrane protein YqjE